jgi:hypothetical protein
MRAGLLGSLFVVLLGCSGENVVAGKEQTKAAQLEASLPSWCQSICTRLSACAENGDCDCTEDGCVCASVDEDCPEECQEHMAAYAQGGDECAAVGQRFKECLDDHGCEILSLEGLCQLGEAESAACPRSNGGSVEDPPMAVGGPTPGTAGSSSGGPSYPGATVTCLDAHGSGGGTPPAGAHVTCEEGRDTCSDGHAYSWICAVGSQGQTGCTCMVDARVVGGFDPGPGCPVLAQVNAGCGWRLTSE